MKKPLLIASVALVVYACGSVNSYTINGTMPDSKSDSTMVYLVDYNSDSTIDSCLVADSKFSFTGALVDSIPIVRLAASGDYRYYANVITEPGVVNVDMNRKSEVSGGALNRAFIAFEADIDSVSDIYSQKFKERTADTNLDAHRAEYASECDKIINKYILGNEKNPLGVYMVWNIASGSAGKQPNVVMLDSLMNNGGEIVQNFTPIKRIRKALVSKEKTAVGNMFVDFDAKNIDDSPAKLSDYVGNGKYVLVDFWASWCGPCKAEIPTIKEVYNNYKDKGLVVLGVNVWDSKEKFQKSLEEEDMPWLHIYQSETTNPTDNYGISGIPHIILFASDGTIAARGLRGDGMKAKLAEVFAEKK